VKGDIKLQLTLPRVALSGNCLRSKGRMVHLVRG